MAAPWDRFRLARPEPVELHEPVVAEPGPNAPTVTRRVDRGGLISFAAAHYRAGVWLAGESVSVICDGGLVHLEHRGVLVAHPCPPASHRQADGRPPARGSSTQTEATHRHRGIGDPQGRLQRQRLLRRQQLPRRIQASPPSSSGRSGRRDGRDLHRGGAHRQPPDTSRPHPRARRAGQPGRPSPPHQCRLTLKRCRQGTGTDLSPGYRDLTLHSSLEPTATSPCAATSSTGRRVRQNAVSRPRKGVSARSTWRAAARIL